MSHIATACPDCGQRYSLKESLQGKTVRCKRCQSPFVVEAPPTPDSPLDLYGLDEDDSPHSSTAEATSEAFEDPIAPPLRRPSRSTGSDRQSRRNSFELSKPAKFALIAAGTMLALSLVLGFFLPGPAIMLAMLVTLLAIGILIGGNLWLLVEAFQVGLLHGILSLVVPFYIFVLTFLNWNTMRRPLAVAVSGYVLTIGLTLWIIALTNHMNRQADQEMAAFMGFDESADVPPTDPGRSAVASDLPSAAPDASTATLPSAPGVTPASTPVVASASTSPVDDTRAILSGLMSESMEAVSLLSSVSSGGTQPDRWERFQEITVQMTQARDQFRTLPPLSDADRQILRDEFTLPLRTVSARLSHATDQALARSAGSGRSETLQIPRSVLTSVAETLGLPPLGSPFPGPGPRPFPRPGMNPGAPGGGPSGRPG